MELINQHTKKIMEGCKIRAADAGLQFQNESLEYIVTNRDLLELSPKVMIPTLYDYWVHDVEILKGKGKYELYPSNPYETVINTRPAISFYNDNNPDWLNVMIFYHVLGHIDFFQNNAFFRHTWDFDFAGQALSDKRVIARLRSEHGRWVDYVIEFSRGIDNLVGYYNELARINEFQTPTKMSKIDFYFDIFLQSVLKVTNNEFIKEIERHNQCVRDDKARCQDLFFAEIELKHPEFESVYQKRVQKPFTRHSDLLQYIMSKSKFLNRDENQWMKTVMQIVRKTSLFFQPQIRTKIMNEGWASFWHEKLFLNDERINGHEVEFARVHANVTSMPRVGLNPYALGMRLFCQIEEMADKGRYDYEFERIHDQNQRKQFDAQTGHGQDFIFHVRENWCDSMFINSFLDQDFITRYKLFVAGKRLNKERMVWEYYVKSRKREDYLKMLRRSLYHPPHVTIDEDKTNETSLHLVHQFEDKPLVKEFIANTMMGIEYLWGGSVHLETHELISAPKPAVGGLPTGYFSIPKPKEKDEPQERKWQRVVYTMQDRKLTKKELNGESSG
jgi:stage V sporulation protein R